MSVSIQKLEAKLGTRLFERDTSGVSITRAELAVLTEAKRAPFHSSQIAQSAVRGTGGPLQIGFVGSAIYGMLQRPVSPFRAQYPGVELVLQEARSVRILPMPESGELDIGLVRTPLTQSSVVSLLPLECDEFIATLPSVNPLARRARLRLSDLRSEKPKFKRARADRRKGQRQPWHGNGVAFRDGKPRSRQVQETGLDVFSSALIPLEPAFRYAKRTPPHPSAASPARLGKNQCRI